MASISIATQGTGHVSGRVRVDGALRRTVRPLAPYATAPVCPDSQYQVPANATSPFGGTAGGWLMATTKRSTRLLGSPT
jgi:hypothetical protein